MRLIDGDAVIEHAEVNGEDREFIRILTDYIEDADPVEPKKVCIGQIHFDDEKLHEIVKEAVQRLKEEIGPKRGEWVNAHGNPIRDKFCVYCSACGEWSEYRTDFCCNCGAKMERGQ